ncbi:putative membrane-anchored protein [Parvibaculum indicum]|uniref:GDYXXLXY domain-containing protein n=1 Tax=Parvibaculum indicum TaxID=562969 RepID=UPI0014217FC3|nr:GDYXXLXY domain-containing protein [Parvibaculum indicum]NIJ40193.1 putative membrane-anchored protein [Parvibaculum indicum]
MTGSRRFAIGLGVLLAGQIAFLGWMIADRVSLLGSDKVVTLRTMPIDPRDIFRGDYVVLRYDISDIALTAYKGTTDLAEGDTVYVELGKDKSGEWRPVGLDTRMMEPAEGNHIIRGRITHIDRRNPGPTAERKEPREVPCPFCGTAHIAYGIESYFVPEGEGRDIETARNRAELTVDVALADDGEAAIKSLGMDGKTIYNEPLF